MMMMMMMMFVKVTGAGQASKPSVWIDAGIHAREWISHATALYFIDRVIITL